MSAEHDNHILLEIRHNIGALDIDSIRPWTQNGDYTGDSTTKLQKIHEGIYLTAMKLEAVEPHDVAAQARLSEVKIRLESDAAMEHIIAGIDRSARQKVAERWTHSR